MKTPASRPEAPREIAAEPRFANRWPLERRLFNAAIIAMLPSMAISFALLWLGDYPDRLRWTLAAVMLVASALALTYLRERVAYSLRTIANLLSAIREGDFSIRLRPSSAHDSLDELIDEANALRDALHTQRIQVAESGALVDRVLAGIDAAILAFDSHRRLRRANNYAERLLGMRFESMEGRTAADLGLAECLDGSSTRVASLPFDDHGRRWELRRSTFRQMGEPLVLVVLWDITGALRSEEQEAWSRLVRVMRHEINNALAPIASLATTMRDVIDRSPRPDDWQTDFREGLSVIVERSEAVARMLQSYTQLSSESPPEKKALDVATLVRRVAAAETRAEVVVLLGPDLTIQADELQLDQALVNLVRNAVDANLATGGATTLGWSILSPPSAPGTAAHERTGPTLEIWVEDEGPGILNPDNLFVPFFTTKPGGSGVGLALARQIAEAHGGTLSIANRTGARGCCSVLRIPVGIENH